VTEQPQTPDTTPAEVEEPDSPGAQPDAPSEEQLQDSPRTSEGSVQPEPERQEEVSSEGPQTLGSPVTHETRGVPPGRPLLVFLNEVAGGRKLLEAVRERAAGASYVVVAAPQNTPAAGQIVDAGQIHDAARSRVDVTLSVLAEFGIDAVGEVLDRDPALALDDVVRAHDPGEVLLSSLYDTRFGLTRRNLVEWAKDTMECEVTHVPVRIEDDSIRWDVTHTLVVATRTVDSPDLVSRLTELHSERPHRYTFVCPRSGDVAREQVCAKLAATLAEMYRADIDATGQPMSPDPFSAVENAIQHYRVDEILISTLAGEQSKWLEENLIGRVREITEKPVEHVETGRPPEAVAAAVAAGPEADAAAETPEGDRPGEDEEG
jgi:hypothetical protein